MSYPAEIQRIDLSDLTRMCQGNDPNQPAYVYAWRRGKKFFYVGLTTNWLKRLAGHHIINSENRTRGGEVVIWRVHSLLHAQLLEASIISRFHPQFNKQDPGVQRHPYEWQFCLICECRTPYNPRVYCWPCEEEILASIGLSKFDRAANVPPRPAGLHGLPHTP
jgi:hypothetical protein